MQKPYVQKIAIYVLLPIFLIALYIAYINKSSNFWLTVAGGIATGTLVAIAQYFVSLSEYKEIDKAYKKLSNKENEIKELKSIGVKKILPARDDPKVYGRIIENSKDKIWVMGNTASRLLEDFANMAGSTTYKDVLLDFLERGGEVKILIAEKKHLFTYKDEKKFDVVKIELEKLRSKYPKFKFKYFKHIPTHSIFIFDEFCLLGPIFDNVDSKATPVLGMDTSCEYAQKYINYFNHQWAQSIGADVEN